MARERYFTGSRFEERGGYARGVRDGDMVFMSGCVGFDYQKDTIADDVVEQTHQAFRNVNNGLDALGSSFADVVRIVIYIADRAYYEEIVDIIGEHCRDVRPGKHLHRRATRRPAYESRDRSNRTRSKGRVLMPTVLITGASRGIGRALADQYESDGWTVIRTCRSPERTEEMALDLSDPRQVQEVAEKLSGTPIDVLINNAGVIGQRDAAIGNIDYDQWEETFRINTLAPMRVAEALAENVAASEKKVMVFVSSVMGSIARNGGGHYLYRSTKAALNAAMVSLSMELESRGVICISMHPGWVRTDMGGPTAAVAVPDSAAGIRNVVAGLGRQDNGCFYDYTGAEIPW